MMSAKLSIVILVVFTAATCKNSSASPTTSSLSSTDPSSPSTFTSPDSRSIQTDLKDGATAAKFQNGTALSAMSGRAYCYRCSSPCPSTICCSEYYPQCCRVNGYCGCCRFY